MVNLFVSLLLVISSALVSEPTGLKVGDKAAMFKAKDQNNSVVSLAQSLEKGPVVLFFYRGAWCPYCNKQMAQLQDSLQMLIGKGATVIAISPETPENVEKTASKNKLGFSVIHDKDGAIMKAYQVAFELDAATAERYKGYGIDLKTHNNAQDNSLPVPATYIIKQDGTVKYVYFNKDYKQRASVAEIMMQL